MQPVVKPVEQPAASCKRCLRVNSNSNCSIYVAQLLVDRGHIKRQVSLTTRV